MLSILIPIHEFDVRAFVSDLSALSVKLNQPCEIICLDDASSDAFRAINTSLSQIENVVYRESDVNLGRSAVRNVLADLAQYENLIFLDCDGKVVREDYLDKYAAIKEYDVVYGGRVYQEDRPVPAELNFHWYCGMAREEIPASIRIQAPFKSFMTNNFMVRKSVYDVIKMDERVKGYGHEDTLFAMNLKRQGFSIQHIDNPIEHIGIEHVDVFLAKSANAVANLAQLMSLKQVDESIKLVRYYRKLERIGLSSLASKVIMAFEQPIMRSLKSAAPNLLWFDLWKLALLSKEMQKTA
jgi:glycosyltransferase involved in cell wall biosynthesis